MERRGWGSEGTKESGAAALARVLAASAGMMRQWTPQKEKGDGGNDGKESD